MKNNHMSRSLYDVDPQVAAAIDNEVRRQHEGLELIASENFVSEAVLEAMGSVFTNKYAEGYPGKRYYGGCEFADVVEDLARERAKKLFGAEHANVQPHAGSQANMEAFAAVLDSELEGPVNIGSDERVALADLVERIARQIGRPELLQLGARPAPPREPSLLVPEIRRLRDEALWRPRFTLNEALSDTIAWWRGRSL